MNNIPTVRKPPISIGFSTSSRPVHTIAAGDGQLTGITETNGLSAYQVAKTHGFIGTVEQWLASLVGPPGNTRGYAFSQPIASNIWTVNHNLGYNPSASCFDDLDDPIMGEVKYMDLNNLIILYSKKISGKAFFS